MACFTEREQVEVDTMACFTVTIFAEDEDEDENNDDEDDHEAGDEDVARTFDQHQKAKPPQTQSQSRDVALLPTELRQGLRNAHLGKLLPHHPVVVARCEEQVFLVSLESRVQVRQLRHVG